jgi:hypothetical protein
MPCPHPREQRATIRFNKVFEVSLSSEDYGEIGAVARNISIGGMLIETPSVPPLGSEVRIRFQIPDSDASIIVRGEVKNHYVFNYAEAGALRWARGIGVRFLEFLADGADQLRVSLGGRTRMRTLH